MRAGRRGRSYRVVLGEGSMTLVMCSHFYDIFNKRGLRSKFSVSALWSR